MTPRSIKLALFAFFSLLCIFIFAAPFAAPYGSFTGLDGTPGIIDHGDLWSRQNIFAGLMYGFGDLICHQEQARSLILNGSEMPVCIRDLAIFIGVAIGSLICTLFERSSAMETYAVPYFIASCALMLADWCIQHFMSLNVPFTRAVTGLLFGSAIAVILSYLINRKFYGKRASR